MAKEKIDKNKNQSICQALLCKKNLLRDFIILAIAAVFSYLAVINSRQFSNSQAIKNNNAEIQSVSDFVAEQEIEEEEIEIPAIETADWKKYQNQWYGFELKYPDGWENPGFEKAAAGAKWEYKYKFRKKEADSANSYVGFDVTIYNIRSVKELTNTQEYPTFKFKMNENETCRFIPGHLKEDSDFPAEEIYIPPADDCYNPAFFYSLTRDAYIYNIAPVLKEDWEMPVELKKDAISNFPEFFSVASSFYLVEIKRPAKPATPKINAPMPVAAVKVDSLGRLVCAKKNDKPSKSDKEKKKHLDMECCLDPDEYPNPHCYYPSEKYGKLLDKLNK